MARSSPAYRIGRVSDLPRPPTAMLPVWWNLMGC